MLIVYFRSGHVLEASILVGVIGQQLNKQLKKGVSQGSGQGKRT